MSKGSSLGTDSSKIVSRLNIESNANESLKEDGKMEPTTHLGSLYKYLPPVVRKRVLALKKLQIDSVHIEADFFTEVHKLECKYNHLYAELNKKRRQIIAGEKEPTDEECDIKSVLPSHAASLDDGAMGDVSNDSVKNSPPPHLCIDANAKGVPCFWLTIFKNVDLLNDMVQPHDEPVLKHLIDIEVEFLENDPMGFILRFIFTPNEYFSNEVLTKFYEMRCKPDENDPFSFEGPEIIKCKGCTIDWHKNKNITMKTIKKKQKHKSQGTFRTVAKVVKNDSFFNFFDPPQLPDDENDSVDVDTQAVLTSDFEIGHYIRERIIPHAVLYYTGEALEEESDLEEEEEDDDDDEITEESDDNETGPKDPKNNQVATSECKQQ